MGKSAAAKEKSIEEAVAKCKSLRAIGLWFKMLNVMKANRTTNEPREGDFTLSMDRVASMVGMSDAHPSEKRASAQRLISFLRCVRVDDEPLIQARGTDFFIMPLFTVARERYRVQMLMKKSRKRNVTPKGVTLHHHHENTGFSADAREKERNVTPSNGGGFLSPSLPLVSLPTTLSSLPPLNPSPSAPDSLFSPIPVCATRKPAAADKPNHQFDLLPLEALPDVLRSPDFQKAWQTWAEYRRDRRQSLTKHTVSRQLSKLAKYGAEHAIASIDYAIEKGWQGLFPENTPNPTSKAANGAKSYPSFDEQNRQKTRAAFAAVANRQKVLDTGGSK